MTCPAGQASSRLWRAPGTPFTPARVQGTYPKKKWGWKPGGLHPHFFGAGGRTATRCARMHKCGLANQPSLPLGFLEPYLSNFRFSLWTTNTISPGPRKGDPGLMVHRGNPNPNPFLYQTRAQHQRVAAEKEKQGHRSMWRCLCRHMTSWPCFDVAKEQYFDTMNQFLFR